MTALTSTQINQFSANGVLLIENAITIDELAGLRVEFSRWIDESRFYSEAYGEIINGRPRFDLEQGHTQDQPALRRVASPIEIFKACENVTFGSKIWDYVADLLGPNIRFHHAKMNSKLPGSKTVVKWHQDFLFDPHSNTDQITALLFLDDVTPENGLLKIVPGSHKGQLYSLWHDGQFTGVIDDAETQHFEANAIECYGPAGSMCLMHVCMAHASGVNRSFGPRTLYINTFAAADAVPLSPPAVPSIHAGRMVRGVEPNSIRSTAFNLETPDVPKGASFFVQQSGGS
jgi:ectoine hydroxylase-related dioxygenase (phytanoyl-CoA dioxygenase family)